jgi:membrane protein DedA with SNARE-associated domain
MSDDAAVVPTSGTPQPPNPLPWEGKAQPADKFLMGAIVLSGLYLLVLMPLTPSLLAHPWVLVLLKGSASGMVTLGGMVRIGEASLPLVVLVSIPGMMMFDWLYWWAGRRWGRRAIDVFIGSHPKAEKRTHQLEKLTKRFGWVAIIIAYFQPVPNVLIYAAAGWTRMRLWKFLVLDLIGSGLWIALCIGLGYAIGQDAVDIAKQISRYGLYLGLGLIVVVFARQYYTASKRAA